LFTYLKKARLADQVGVVRIATAALEKVVLVADHHCKVLMEFQRTQARTHARTKLSLSHMLMIHMHTSPLENIDRMV
jgi:hypothetical protein